MWTYILALWKGGMNLEYCPICCLGERQTNHFLLVGHSLRFASVPHYSFTYRCEPGFMKRRLRANETRRSSLLPTTHVINTFIFNTSVCCVLGCLKGHVYLINFLNKLTLNFWSRLHRISISTDNTVLISVNTVRQWRFDITNVVICFLCGGCVVKFYITVNDYGCNMGDRNNQIKKLDNTYLHKVSYYVRPIFTYMQVYYVRYRNRKEVWT